MRTYRFIIDGAEMPHIEEHKFQDEAESIKYGEQRFGQTTAPYLTVEDAKGKVIKEFEV